MNLPLPGPAITALNNLVGRALDLDNRAAKRLEPLENSRFRIVSLQPPLQVDITIAAGRINFGPATEEAATTCVTGTWLEFARVVTARDPASALINGAVTVSGDTAPLLELRDILSTLDLDWEAPLSRVVGDVAAHQIGRGLRGVPRVAGELFSHFRRQVREFVVEESGAVPHPIEVEDFSREVEQLAERCDRLEAQVRNLKQS